MTTTTICDPRSAPDLDTLARIVTASETPPGEGVSAVGSDLESSVQRCRADLIRTARELKRDVRPWAAEVRGKLKAALAELAHLLDWGVADGWASISGPVTHKLEQWLTTSTRELAARRAQL